MSGVAAGRERQAVVAALFVVACFAWGLAFYGLGFYLRSLHAQGWSLAMVSWLTLAFQAAATGLGFVVGPRIERHGPRPVFAVGAVALATAVFSIGRAQHLLTLAAAYLVLAIGWACLNTNPISATVIAWHPDGGARQLSVALTGASVGGIVGIPVLDRIDRAAGFATATSVAAVAVLAVLLPVALLVLRRPPAAPEPSSGSSPARPSAASIVRNRRFWAIAAPALLSVGAQVGFLVHQLTFLGETLSSGTAATIVSATAVAALAGRLLFAAMVARFGVRRSGAGFVAGQLLALVFLAAGPRDVVALALGSVVFGAGVGVLITMPPLLTRAGFPDVPFGAVFPFVSAAQQAGVALGPLVVSVAHGAAGGYRSACAVMAAAHTSALAVLLRGSRAD